MPNLFSKIASQNGTLKLCWRKAIKSLVPLIDVARCFKFMEEKNDISFETFNLSKDIDRQRSSGNLQKYNNKIELKRQMTRFNLDFLYRKKLLNTG